MNATVNETQKQAQQGTAIGVWPTLIYRDGQAALKFLTEGLGFTLVASYAGAAEGSIAHAELAWPVGGGVMVSSVDRNAEPNEFDAFVDQKSSVYLVHDDPDGDGRWRDRGPGDARGGLRLARVQCCGSGGQRVEHRHVSRRDRRVVHRGPAVTGQSP